MNAKKKLFVKILSLLEDRKRVSLKTINSQFSHLSKSSIHNYVTRWVDQRRFVSFKEPINGKNELFISLRTSVCPHCGREYEEVSE